MAECIYNNGNYCEKHSDDEVKQPCVEGPCKDDTQLLPCPFCGGEAKVTKGYPRLLRPSRNHYCVECFECGLQFGHDCDYGGEYATPEEAIEAWNRRVGSNNA